MFAELNTGVAESGDERNKPTSWRMDENTLVTAIPDDSAHVMPYGRRGKTGKTMSLPMVCFTCHIIGNFRDKSEQKSDPYDFC